MRTIQYIHAHHLQCTIPCKTTWGRGYSAPRNWHPCPHIIIIITTTSNTSTETSIVVIIKIISPGIKVASRTSAVTYAGVNQPIGENSEGVAGRVELITFMACKLEAEGAKTVENGGVDGAV